MKKAAILFILLNIILFFAFTNTPAFAADVTVQLDPADRLMNKTVFGEWATPGNLDGWSGTNISGLTSTGGYITGTGTASDPNIRKTGMSAPDLDFGYNDYLQIRIKVPASFDDDIIFQFGTSLHTGFSTSREFRIPDANIPKDGNWHSYRLDLGLVVWWRDTFRDMKIQPLGNSGNGQTFYIDYVEVGDYPGDVLSVNTNLNFADGENLGSCSRIESKHAVFWYSPTSYTVDGAGFNPTTMSRRALRMIEESYQIYYKKLGYKEPFVSYTGSPTTRYKVNHTTWWSGYWMGGMGNYGYLNVPRSGLLDEGWGSPVPHEFGHVVQSHQPGYLTGGHWESHANFLRDNRTSHYKELFTTHPSDLDTWAFELGNLHQDHKRLIYHDFRIHYALKDFAAAMGLDPETVGKFWTEPPKEMTVYDKLAQMLPEGFDIKDVVAFCMRHWPFLDFGSDGDNFKTTLWGTANNKAWWYYITGSLLTPCQDKPGWWRVPFERAPEKFAFMYHELDATDSNITVEFRGFNVIGNTEDWRWSLAAMDGSGNLRFSDLWSPGTQSFTLNPGETKVYLIVSATPSDTSLDLDTYYNLKPNDKHIDRLRYGYEVRIIGATPAKRQLAWTKGAGSYLSPSQGGGWKDSTATVSATAYVGPNAMVLGTAKVYDYARIEDYAVIKGNAAIRNYATVSGYAVVMDSAIVRNYAKVRDRAIVASSAIVEGNAVIENYAHLIDSTHVYESAICRGLAYPWGSSSISGTAIADYDYSYNWTLTDGTHFGHFPWGDYFRNYFDVTQKKPRGLVASYRVEEGQGEVLWDEFGAKHALLRGNPSRPFDVSMNSPVLRLDGLTQYVVLDRSLCDFAAGSFSISVKPSGPNTDKPVLFMGSSAGKYLKLVARNSSQKASFTITDGVTTKTLVSDSNIPISLWTNLAVTFSGTTAKLYVDGAEEDSISTTLVPDDCLGANDYAVAEGFYVARDYSGSLFAGDIDDARFYNVALTIDEVQNEARRSGDCIGAMYYNQEAVFNGTSTEAQSGVHDGLVRVLEAEVYPDTSDSVGYYEGIFDSTDSNYPQYIGSGFGLNDGKIVVRLDNYGFWYTNVSVTLGAWQKITLVFDGSMATLYVNDVQRKTRTYTASVSDVAGKNYRIGFAEDTGFNKYYFDGKLRNVYIYDRVPGTGESLPPPWLNEDIGSVGATGIASYQDGAFIVKGSGAGIEATADEFQYVYQPMSGNGQIVVYVASQQDNSHQPKAGVMIRQSLDADSKNVMIYATPAEGDVFQYREETAGDTFSFPAGIGTHAPCWLRLVRSGDNFMGYVSTNGIDWVMYGYITIPMPQDVYVGMAVTSHYDGYLSSAGFDQVEIRKTLSADVNQDGLVNLEDLSLIVSQWLFTGCSETADMCLWTDLDMDGDIDFQDIAVFALQW
jgi:hypothetical protein